MINLSIVLKNPKYVRHMNYIRLSAAMGRNRFSKQTIRSIIRNLPDHVPIGQIGEITKGFLKKALRSMPLKKRVIDNHIFGNDESNLFTVFIF